MDAELDEELVHLAEIGGVAVGVEEGGCGHGVADVEGDDLGATAGREPEHLHVLAVGEAAERDHPGLRLRHHLVRRRRRREESQLRCHRGRHSSHQFPLLSLSLSLSLCESGGGRCLCERGERVVGRGKLFTIIKSIKMQKTLLGIFAK